VEPLLLAGLLTFRKTDAFPLLWSITVVFYQLYFFWKNYFL